MNYKHKYFKYLNKYNNLIQKGGYPPNDRGPSNPQELIDFWNKPSLSQYRNQFINYLINDTQRDEKNGHYIWWLYPNIRELTGPVSFNVELNTMEQYFELLKSSEYILARELIDQKPIEWFNSPDFTRVNKFRENKTIFPINILDEVSQGLNSLTIQSGIHGSQEAELAKVLEMSEMSEKQRLEYEKALEMSIQYEKALKLSKKKKEPHTSQGASAHSYGYYSGNEGSSSQEADLAKAKKLSLLKTSTDANPLYKAPNAYGKIFDSVDVLDDGNCFFYSLYQALIYHDKYETFFSAFFPGYEFALVSQFDFSKMMRSFLSEQFQNIRIINPVLFNLVYQLYLGKENTYNLYTQEAQFDETNSIFPKLNTAMTEDEFIRFIVPRIKGNLFPNAFILGFLKKIINDKTGIEINLSPNIIELDSSDNPIDHRNKFAKPTKVQFIRERDYDRNIIYLHRLRYNAHYHWIQTDKIL